jgi:hypothetical protein
MDGGVEKEEEGEHQEAQGTRKAQGGQEGSPRSEGGRQEGGRQEGGGDAQAAARWRKDGCSKNPPDSQVKGGCQAPGSRGCSPCTGCGTGARRSSPDRAGAAADWFSARVARSAVSGVSCGELDRH